MFRRRRRVTETQEGPHPPPGGQYVREEVVEPPPPRGPLLLPWLLLLLVLVAGGLAAAYFLTRDSEGPASHVPNVAGLRMLEAIQRRGQSRYAVDVRRRTTRTQVGRVLDQMPDAGVALDRGAKVVIFVGRGPRMVQVPTVVRLPVALAFERLQAVGFRGRVKEVPAQGQMGVVIRQKPAGGIEARRDSTVELVVSRGPKLVAVPSLVGRTEAEASATLQALGLRANVVRVTSRDPAGTVVAQRPLPGARLPKGLQRPDQRLQGRVRDHYDDDDNRLIEPSDGARCRRPGRGDRTRHPAGRGLHGASDHPADDRPGAGRGRRRPEPTRRPEGADGSRVILYVGRIT